MTDSIVGAQERVSEDNNFQFDGPLMANEAGHIANLTNQLRTVLLELRTRCLHFTSNHGVNELRKCNFCGLVWAKVVGCTGSTTCGELVNSFDVRKIDDNKKATGVMATFTFKWDDQVDWGGFNSMRSFITKLPSGTMFVRQRHCMHILQKMYG